MKDPASGWLTADAPQADEFQSCIKCGLCLPSCPTFQETGLERESPRGRVQLIRSVAQGLIPLENGPLAETLFTCLDCRACESACPSGVPIGRLIEKGRAEVVQQHIVTTPAWARWLEQVLAHPGRLKVARRVFKAGQQIGLWQRRNKWPGLPASVSTLASTVRPLPSKAAGGMPVKRLAKAHARDTVRVQLFLGCIMDAAFSDAHEATVRVLSRHGCSVTAPEGQVCCGALAVHAGNREEARRLARINVDRFGQGADYIATNAGGCGAALLEYPDWLKDDPRYANRAREFSSRVHDAMQILDLVGFEPPSGPFPYTVTYQGSCHLHHVMKVGNIPERLLQSLPGSDYRPMPDMTRCCGSAGIYNLTHPAMADALLRRKMMDIPTGAEVVATGNPGCWLQMEQGVKRFGPPVTVMHIMQVLDRAYANAPDAT